MELDHKWLLTCDDEKWENNNFGTFDTKEEVMAYIKEKGATKLYDIWLDEIGENPPEEQSMITFYVGQVVAFVPSVNGDDILENIVDDAYDCGGEHADGYMQDVTDEQQSELEDAMNTVLAKWIEKHQLEPNFYQILEIEEIELELK